MVMQAGNKAAVYPGDPFCEGSLTLENYSD